MSEEIKDLAADPNLVARCCKGFLVNGFRFHINSRAQNMTTQNSGVVVSATTECYASSRDRQPRSAILDYYGVLEKILILDYYSKGRVVLMDCTWFDTLSESGMKTDDNGFTLVNMNRRYNTNESYIFASQAHQVFYVNDLMDPQWGVVVRTMPRHIYDDPNQGIENNDMLLQTHSLGCENIDASIDPLTMDTWARDDGVAEYVEGPPRDGEETEEESGED